MTAAPISFVPAAVSGFFLDALQLYLKLETHSFGTFPGLTSTLPPNPTHADRPIHSLVAVKCEGQPQTATVPQATFIFSCAESALFQFVQTSVESILTIAKDPTRNGKYVKWNLIEEKLQVVLTLTSVSKSPRRLLKRKNSKLFQENSSIFNKTLAARPANSHSRASGRDPTDMQQPRQLITVIEDRIIDFTHYFDDDGKSKGKTTIFFEGNPGIAKNLNKNLKGIAKVISGAHF